MHRGRYAVCDSGGNVIESGGDSESLTWVRSSAKPFQAMPLAGSGAAAALGLTGEEISVACGSHAGERRHLDAVSSILHKAGLPETALRNGAHPPLNAVATEELVRAGEEPRPIHGNCSGKHAGMLALCVYRGWDTGGYRDPDHPLQREILSAIREACGLGDDDVRVGGDGCGAPAFAMPLRSLATGFASLASGGVPEPFDEAANLVSRSMREQPFMVAGTGRLDTRIMRSSEVVCKSGAEGVFAAGLPDGTGISIKVSDGAGRAVEAAAISLLRRFGAQDLPEPRTVVNDLHGAEVGAVESLI